ncbi:MAG: hypothetical protein ACRDJL_00805 [Actinomycetota bacterium]
MATTEDRLRQSERLEELWKQPSAEPERTGVDPLPPVHRAPRESRDWSRPLLVAWVATMLALYIFEPRPTDPTATPLWGTILLFAFTYMLFGSIVGLASRRPWGLRTSAFAGCLGIIVAGACAATGHHAGAWWIFEGLAFTGLAAGSLAALRALR